MKYTHFVVGFSHSGYSEVYPIARKREVLNYFFGWQLIGVRITHIYGLIKKSS